MWLLLIKTQYFSGSANMLGEEEKTNAKLENNLKKEKKVNQNASKNKVKDEKAQCKYKKYDCIHSF